jgi:hypothetical protein
LRPYWREPAASARIKYLLRPRGAVIQAQPTRGALFTSTIAPTTQASSMINFHG